MDILHLQQHITKGLVHVKVVDCVDVDVDGDATCCFDGVVPMVYNELASSLGGTDKYHRF
jgi:hypothetical protein